MSHPLVITYDALLKLSTGTTDEEIAEYVADYVRAQPNRAQAATDLATAILIAFHLQLTEDHGDEHTLQTVQQLHTNLILEDATGDINELLHQS